MRAWISSILSLMACMSSGVKSGSLPVPIMRREICRKSTASSPPWSPIWTTCGSLSATAASRSRTSCWKRYSRISGAAALLTARISSACASSRAALALAVLSASTILSRALALARFVSRSRAVSIWAGR